MTTRGHGMGFVSGMAVRTARHMPELTCKRPAREVQVQRRGEVGRGLQMSLSAMATPRAFERGEHKPEEPLPVPHVECEAELSDALSLRADVTVLQVYSRRCRSCKRIERPFARLAGKYAGRISCVRFCAERDEELAQRIGVRGFPTFILYKHGTRVDHFASNSPDVLEEAIVDLL